MGWDARLSKIVDRCVGIFSPAAAADRLDARGYMKAAQKALMSENSDNTSPTDTELVHPDTDLIQDSPLLRRRCTLAYYNNSLVKGIVDSETRQVIGSLSVQSHTGNKRADMLIEDEWKRRMDDGLLETLQTSAKHMLIDGGSVLNPLTAPSEPVEAEVIPYRRIKTPFNRTDGKVRDGFERGARGKFTKVYVMKEESFFDQVLAFNGEWLELPYFSHSALPRLAGQTKGLSWMHAAIVRLEMIDRWMESLLASAELHSKVVALIRSASKETSGMTGRLGSVDDTLNARVLTYARKNRFLFLPDGADYKLIQADAPVIAEFLIWSLRFVARAMGVSFERLTYDLSQTSFSSTKFGDRDDRITVMEHQGIIEHNDICSLNRRMIAGLFMRPELRMPGAAAYAADPYTFESAVRFSMPGRPPVDEVKTETANEMALRNRTASRTRMTADRGADLEEIEDELIREDASYLKKREKMYADFGLDKKIAQDLALEDLRSAMFSKSTYTGQDEQDPAAAQPGAKAKPGQPAQKPKQKEAA